MPKLERLETDNFSELFEEVMLVDAEGIFSCFPESKGKCGDVYIYCKKLVQCVSDAEVPEIISPYSLVIVKFYFLSHLFVLVWFLA